MAMYSFIAEEKADPYARGASPRCAGCWSVSRAGFYDWESRPRSRRDRR